MEGPHLFILFPYSYHMSMIGSDDAEIMESLDYRVIQHSGEQIAVFLGRSRCLPVMCCALEWNEETHRM